MKITSALRSLLEEGGPSSSRLLNLVVGIGLTVALMRVTWVMDDPAQDVTWAYWALFTSYACYGMGTANFSKWLSIIRLKLGGGSEAEKSKTAP